MVWKFKAPVPAIKGMTWSWAGCLAKAAFEARELFDWFTEAYVESK